MLEPPTERRKGAGSIGTRTVKIAQAGKRPKDYFPDLIRGSILRWFVPWWDIPMFTAAKVEKGARGIMILSLDFGVHFHPLRLMRQMGKIQLIPQDLTIRQPSVPIGGIKTDSRASEWRDCRRWRVPEPRATITVSAAYRNWIRIIREIMTG